RARRSRGHRSHHRRAHGQTAAQARRRRQPAALHRYGALHRLQVPAAGRKARPDRRGFLMRLHRVMPSLRLRLIGLFVVLALAVAAVMILAVERFSADQIMALAKQGGASPSEAQAMFDTYVARVLIVGALVGVALGAFAAWWLLRRILQPLDRLAEASRAIAEGDLGARVPDPPDPELRGLATAFNQMAATLERVEQLARRWSRTSRTSCARRSPVCRATPRRS